MQRLNSEINFFCRFQLRFAPFKLNSGTFYNKSQGYYAQNVYNNISNTYFYIFPITVFVEYDVFANIF